MDVTIPLQLNRQHIVACLEEEVVMLALGVALGVFMFVSALIGLAACRAGSPHSGDASFGRKLA
jgi:hypothetical protein